MSLRELDVARFSREAVHRDDHGVTDLGMAMAVFQDTVETWARIKFITNNKTASFGFAVGHFMTARAYGEAWWDAPEKFVWFVGGWGPRQEQYIANAVRKLRPLLRLGEDTMSVRFNYPELFQDTVEKDTITWGDFPWGGATFTEVDGLFLPTAVSGLKQEEDHLVSPLLGRLIEMKLLQKWHPELRS